MRSRQIWFWFSLAVGLFLFIFFYERHTGKPVGLAPAQEILLVGFKPGAASSIEIRRGQQVTRLQTNGASWLLTTPLTYPANPVLAENLLHTLAQLDGRNHIAAENLADFGLATPESSIIIQQGPEKFELHIGSPTPVGGQVYVRVPGLKGIFTADAAALAKAVPASPNDWRSLALLTANTTKSFDRFEVRSRTRGQGWTLVHNPTNKTWRLTKPALVRADRLKVEQLLLRCLQSRVVSFVSDNPAEDPEPYGCQPPELELVFGAGTNDILTVQFGKSPTNDPASVYARRLSHTNIVLARRDLAESLRVSSGDLRDLHLFTFPPALVQQIDVAGDHAFSLRRQTNGAWRVVEPQEFPADASLVKEFLGNLYGWEGKVAKDVVTDYSDYGLIRPLREVSLKAAATNAAGGMTNLLITAAAFGTNSAGNLFARRHDEGTVYAIEEGDYLNALFDHGWQLRDRHIWNFPATNIVRIRVRQGTQANEFIRNGPNDWFLGATSKGFININAVEEIAAQLSTLTATYWLERGEAARAKLGFPTSGLVVEVEVREGAALQTYLLEFSAARDNSAPCACVKLDGQPWFFKFSRLFYDRLLRDLPLPSAVTGTP